ncbi:unnamed protein product [Menidia menidia]|uniref:(Atlantic silverside) hypothetical protein n=1 Tax=Menidia menidia TaxID=238744 RepID=A0A8S4BR75_9TELE|nr:unnamed protein product [Menidia menidia]CAG5997698.1 unnamed protein product [Menidia menidia]
MSDEDGQNEATGLEEQGYKSELSFKALSATRRGPRRESSQRDIPGLQAKDRLSAVRVQFINGVSDSVLNQLLDKLLQHGAMINEEMQTAKTKSRAEKAPDVIDTVMRKGHEKAAKL